MLISKIILACFFVIC